MALAHLDWEGRRIRYKSYRKINPTWISIKDESGADGGSQFAEAAYANIPRLTFDASGEATRGIFRYSTCCTPQSAFAFREYNQILHLWHCTYCTTFVSFLNISVPMPLDRLPPSVSTFSNNSVCFVVCSRLYKFQLSPEVSGPLNQALAKNAMKEAISSLGIGDILLYCTLLFKRIIPLHYTICDVCVIYVAVHPLTLSPTHSSMQL